MLVTALLPVIDYDKPSKIAHYAMDNDLTLKAAALKLAFVTQTEFDRIVEHSCRAKLTLLHLSGSRDGDLRNASEACHRRDVHRSWTRVGGSGGP